MSSCMAATRTVSVGTLASPATTGSGPGGRSSSSCKLKHRVHVHSSSPYNRNNNNSSVCSSSATSSSDESCSEVDLKNELLLVQKKQKRNAANMRERNRMHVVNFAFDRLREVVPAYPGNRKLSKIETLRMACTYIKDLTDVLKNTSTVQPDDANGYVPTPASMNDSTSILPTSSMSLSNTSLYQQGPPPAYTDHSSTDRSPETPDSPYYPPAFHTTRPVFSRTCSDSVIIQQSLCVRPSPCQPSYVIQSPTNHIASSSTAQRRDMHQVCTALPLTRIGSDPFWGNSMA